MIEDLYPDDDSWQQEQAQWEAAYMSTVYEPNRPKDYLFRFDYVLRGTPVIIEVKSVEGYRRCDAGHVHYNCWEGPQVDYNILDCMGRLDLRWDNLDPIDEERIEEIIMLEVSKGAW